MNKIILAGNTTKDAEIRYAKDNKPIARFGIAVQRKYKNQDGNYDTDFFNLTAFGPTATFVEKHVVKGTRVIVEGEIRNNNYEKDGKTVYQDQIIVSSIEFGGSKKENGNAGADAPAEAPAQDGDGFNAVDESVTEDDLPFV